MKQFITCHCHPNSLDTASTPAAFAEKELELGSPAITCTDHGTLAGTHQVYSLAKKKGLIPIIGLEGYFRDDSCPILGKLGIKKTGSVPRGQDADEWRAKYPDGTYYDYLKYQHITLHFLDHEAYRKGMEVLSVADQRAERHGSERKPLFNWDNIEELAAHNVTATTSCLVGMVQRHLLAHENGAAAQAYFHRLKHLFGDRFYVEVFPHVCSHDFQKAVYITGIDIDGNTQTMKWSFSKKLRTNKTGTDEITAADLALVYGSTNNEHTELREIKHYQTWTPLEKPLKITNVDKVHGYIQNECKPWAPNGDVQYGCNRYVLGLAKKHDVPVLIGDDCLASDTVIRCIDTYRFVSDVRPGHVVVAHDGTPRKVEATRGFFTAKDLVDVSVGGESVTMTVDHRVWAKKALRHNKSVYHISKNCEVEPEWIYAANLEAGDLVFVPCRESFCGNQNSCDVDLSTYITRRWMADIGTDSIEIANYNKGVSSVFARYLNLDKDFAWLVGFFLGDGNAHNNLTSFVSENEIYESVVRPKLLDLCERMRFRWDEVKHKNHTTFRVINTCFTQFMRKNFYIDKTKTVPQWFSDMSVEWCKQVAAGLMYSDGSGDGARYCLAMTSLSVTGWFRDFILQLGVYCSFGQRYTTGATKPLYAVNCPQEINSVLDRTTERKKKRWIQSDGGYWIRVKSVKSSSKSKEVYDLQVADVGSFCTAAFAVHNSHFTVPAEKVVQDVRLCQHGGDSWRFASSYHRRSTAEAWDYFKNVMKIPQKQFEGWVENSHEWASRFKGFKIDSTPLLPTKFYPDNTLEHTGKLILKHGRMVRDSRYMRRLEEEIELLHRNGKIDLLPYFFLDEEVCRLYRDEGLITGPGRGSAAGLLLTYLLGITHVDPLKFGLSKERFLTVDRIKSGKLPDIDQDLPSRDLLVGGYETDVVDFEAEDGTTHSAPASFLVSTPEGEVPVGEAVERGLDFEPWWQPGDRE